MENGGAGLPTIEHDDRIVGEVEARHKQVPHALGVVDAALELVARVAVRDPAHHGALPPVRRRRGRAPPRRRLHGAAAGVGVRGGGDVRDGPADGAADAGRPVRQLQRGAAPRAVDQHHHPARRSRSRVGVARLCRRRGRESTGGDGSPGEVAGGLVGLVRSFGGAGFGLRVSAWLVLLFRWEKHRARGPRSLRLRVFIFLFPSCLRMMTASLTDPGPTAAVDCAINARKSEQVLLCN
jgi:hypothetical protein